MIAGVWLLSLIISSPPLIGWNDWPPRDSFEVQQICELTKRQGYVIYSSLGSFYIPLFIMTIVYVQIFVATKRRLRERAQAAKINISKNTLKNKEDEQERESVSSEIMANEHFEVNGKTKDKKSKKKNEKDADTNTLKPILTHDDSLTDNCENSSSSQRRLSLNPGSSEKMISTSTATIALSNSKPSPKVIIEKKPGFVYQFIEEKQRISLSKERRAARTLGIIMGVFVVCWLPFFLMYVIIPFCPICCPSRRLINFITWLGYINSVLNPIIYTIFNMDFRRAFRKLLRFENICP